MTNRVNPNPGWVLEKPKFRDLDLSVIEHVIESKLGLNKNDAYF